MLSKFWQGAKSWLPGLVISAICIVLILYFVDLHELVDAIREANVAWLALSVVISVIWLVVRSLVWRTLLRERASFRDAFLTVNEGYLLNNFLPLRLGELGRAFLLSRKADLTFMEILPTIVIERIIDLAFSAIILLGAVPFVPGMPEVFKRSAYVAGAVVVVGLVALYILAQKHDWALATFDKFSVRWPMLQRLGGDLLKSFFEGLAILTDGWLFLRVLGLMTINWSIAIVQFLVLLLAFFPAAQVPWAMFGLGAVAFGGAVPALPGGVGTYEASLSAALTLVTSDSARSLAAAIIAHVLAYLVSGALGIYALSTEGETLSGVYRELIEFRQAGQKNQ